TERRPQERTIVSVGRRGSARLEMRRAGTGTESNDTLGIRPDFRRDSQGRPNGIAGGKRGPPKTQRSRHTIGCNGSQSGATRNCYHFDIQKAAAVTVTGVTSHRTGPVGALPVGALPVGALPVGALRDGRR